MINRSGRKYTDHIRKIRFTPSNGRGQIEIETDDGKYINFVKIILNKKDMVILRDAIITGKNYNVISCTDVRRAGK